MDDIPGSKPKKLIKRQNFSNPTLLSNCISPIFNAQTRIAETEREEAKNLIQQKDSSQVKHHQRKKSQISFKFDSLDAAEDQFYRKNKQSNSIRLIDRVNPSKFQKLIENKLSSSGYQATIQSCNHSYATKFNHIHSNSIKAKQNIGYNIISGIETGKF